MKAKNKIQPEVILEQDVELFSHKDISEDNILFEDVKKRDEHTKHFRTKDGKYIAATYKNPIHVLDESTGEYVDIADTFEEKEDCFESKNPRYNARFPKEDSEESFVSIEKNGRSVDWHFRSKKSAKKKASVKKKEKHSKLESPILPGVRYEGNSDDCVLEYKLTESGIKEDIILFSRPEKSEFEFDFKVKGLNAVLADDKKTIKLFADDSKFYYTSKGDLTKKESHFTGTPEKCFISKVDYDTHGRIEKVYDSRNDNYVTNYSYTSPYGLLANKTDPNDQKYTYGYDLKSIKLRF